MIYDVVILATENPWTWALANALRHRFGDVPVILEDKEPMTLFWRRRIVSATGSFELTVRK